MLPFYLCADVPEFIILLELPISAAESWVIPPEMLVRDAGMFNPGCCYLCCELVLYCCTFYEAIVGAPPLVRV